MCSPKFKLTFFSLAFCLLFTSLTAQPRDYMLVSVSTNIPGIALGQMNGQVQIAPLPFIGIVATAAFKTEQKSIDLFTKTTKSLALGGELRLYPFGAPKLYNATEFLRYGFRSEASLSNSWAQTFLSGLYMGLGYEHRKIDLEFIPDQSLNSPWPNFDYDIQDSGASMQLGYNLILSHFSIDVGYHLRFSQPEWQGPVDVFGENVYTKTYPVAYRHKGAFQVSIGAAF